MKWGSVNSEAPSQSSFPLRPLLLCQQFHQTETILQDETGFCRGNFVIPGNSRFRVLFPTVDDERDRIAGVGHEADRRGVVRGAEDPVFTELFDPLADGRHDLGIEIFNGLNLVLDIPGMG